MALSLATDPPRIEVVEVTGNSNTGDLARKIGWYRDNARKIKDGILRGGLLGPVQDSPLGVKVSISQAQIENFSRSAAPEVGDGIAVQVYALEDVLAALLDWRPVESGKVGPRRVIAQTAG